MMRLAEQIQDACGQQADALVLRLMARMVVRTYHRELDAPALDRAAWVRRYYAGRAPDAFFARPPEGPALVARPLAPLPGGTCRGVIGASGFLPDLADFRGEWAAWRRNATLRATVYEHAGAPRPLVIALHGWSMGWPPLDARILDVRPLYDLGLDVALLTLPFHGARTEGRPGSAPPYPSPRLAVTVEAVRQAVWDVRRLAAFLRAGTDQGRPLGLYGWSLGGYVSALLAGLEPGLAAVACANPAGSLAELLWRHAGHVPERPRLEAAGFGLPHLEATWSIIDPLRYPSRVAPDRTFVAAGRADAICPPAQAGRIARHLGTRSVHLHGGGHLARFDRAGLRAAVVRFFSETMG